MQIAAVASVSCGDVIDWDAEDELITDYLYG